MSSSAASSPERDRARLARVEELRVGGVSSVPALLDELIQPTWAVRRAVVAALAELGQPALEPLCRALRVARDNEARIAGVVDALVALRGDADAGVMELLNDAQPAVLCDAAQILGRRASARALPALEALTRHESDNVALAAVEAIGRIGGSSALEPLLSLAESGHFFRAFPAIDVLGRAGDVRALPTLLRLLPDPLYGAEAIRALGRLGDQGAIAPLVEQLSKSGENGVRAIASALSAIHERSLQRFGTGLAVERALQGAPNLSNVRRQLLSALVRADPAEQVALGRALSFIGEESTVAAMLALLDGPSAASEVAAASLKRLVGTAEPALIDALRAGSSGRRRLLLPVLGGRVAARDAFIACLEDEDAGVRALACDALGKASDPSAVAALFPLLRDEDLRVSQAALAAVQSLGSDETRRLALGAVHDPDLRVRCAALRIIGYFAYPEGFLDLAQATRDPDERVRGAALAGLPLMEDERGVDAILLASRHVSARTRALAIRALGQVPPSARVSEALRGALSDSDAWVRYYACQSLGKQRNEAAAEALAARLGDESGQVRVGAVDALAQLSGQRAFDALISLVRSEDPELFRAALVALGHSKRVEALAPLLQAANSAAATTRLVALSALAELALPETIAVIARAAEDGDAGVRTAAEAFLAGQSHASATSELVRLLSKAPERESLVRALARPVAGRVEAIAAALALADDALAATLVAALARMQTDEARQRIRALLGSSNDSVRRAVAAALVATRDPEASRALSLAALNDPDPEVRRICAASLGR